MFRFPISLYPYQIWLFSGFFLLLLLIAILMYVMAVNQKKKKTTTQKITRFDKDIEKLVNSHPNVCDGEGNGTPLQYSCLENPMDGEAW